MFFLLAPLEFDDCGSEKSKEPGGAGPQPESDRSRIKFYKNLPALSRTKIPAQAGSWHDEAIRSANLEDWISRWRLQDLAWLLLYGLLATTCAEIGRASCRERV